MFVSGGGVGDRGVAWVRTPLPTRPQRYCDPVSLVNYGNFGIKVVRKQLYMTFCFFS